MSISSDPHCPLARARFFFYNMRMKSFCLILALCGTFCLAGCFTVESEVSKTNGEEHVVVINYGWSLFNCIPLFCGNTTTEGRNGPWAFFRDDVTMDKVQSAFLNHAKERGRTATDLNYHNYDTIMINLPILGLPIPIPYIITYKEVQLSGVLK